MRRCLNADQNADFTLDATDVRLEDVEIGVAFVVTGIEIDVRNARLAPRRPHHFHHFIHRLLVGIVHAQVQPDRAELAIVPLGFLQPVLADPGGIHAEVRSLQRTDLGHDLAGGGVGVVPLGPRGERDIDDRLAAPRQAVAASNLLQHVRTLGGEALGDRNVGPHVAWQDQFQAAAQARPRAQDFAATVLLDEARVGHPQAFAVQVEFEQ
jgi:hypothetical protein